MGQKEKNRLRNQEKKRQQWLERQAEVQKCRKYSPYNMYESDCIWKHALENGFD